MKVRGISGWIAILLVASCWHPCFAAQDAPAETRHVVTRAAPVYPDLARRMNLTGIVRLRVRVTPEGLARKAEVIGGNPVLATAAQDAVSRWKWTPAPQETTEIVELSFHPK